MNGQKFKLDRGHRTLSDMAARRRGLKGVNGEGRQLATVWQRRGRYAVVRVRGWNHQGIPKSESVDEAGRRDGG